MAKLLSVVALVGNFSGFRGRLSERQRHLGLVGEGAPCSCCWSILGSVRVFTKRLRCTHADSHVLGTGETSGKSVVVVLLVVWSVKGE